MSASVSPKNRIGRMAAIATAAASLAAAFTPATGAEVRPAATDTSPTFTALPEITIFAPEIVRRRVGTGRFGNSVEVISLTRTVSYSDLDLTTEPGATELRHRIRVTARETCEELDRRAPSSLLLGPHPDVCVQNATAEALAVAKDVIAAVRAAQK